MSERLTPDNVRAAVKLLDHLTRRRGEASQLNDIGTTLHAVTLHFNGGHRISISTNADMSDTEQMRVDLIEAVSGIVATSIQATLDHLADIGVDPS